MVQEKQSIPAIWVQTTAGAYNAMRPQGYGAFLSVEQQARLERIRQARLLFDGKHREYFIDEQRTQFNFAIMKAGGRTVQMYSVLNLLGLISLKTADLLFGEEALVRSDDATQQASIDALAERTGLHALLYGCAVDASYEAECFLEAIVQDGAVYLQQVPADQIFPLGELRPDGQYARYARYELKDVGVEGRPIYLLLETTYSVGRIERAVWQLKDNGHKGNRVAIDKWPMPEGLAPLVDSQPTGLTANTITWIPNLLIRRKPVSDYDGAIDLQDNVNAKQTQIARVLAKHADPKLGFPEEVADGNGNVAADQDSFFFREPDRVPKYITWNAELEHAMQDRTFGVNQLLVRTETSPVLLGLKEGAAPDAYKKVRLESFNSLTKAARKAAFWKAGIRRAIGVALDLENTLPGVRYDRGPIAVELRDGIPQDDKEQAERQGILRGANLISRRRALLEQLKDAAAVEKEIAELDAEAKAAAPSVLLDEPTDPAIDAATGEPIGGGEETPPAGGGENQSDAVAGNDLRGTVGALNAIRDLQADYYGGVIPREAVISNAMTMLGFAQAEAEQLFPEVAPDAPGGGDAPTPPPAFAVAPPQGQEVIA